jgi:hypothetical protein
METAGNAVSEIVRRTHGDALSVDGATSDRVVMVVSRDVPLPGACPDGIRDRAAPRATNAADARDRRLGGRSVRFGLSLVTTAISARCRRRLFAERPEESAGLRSRRA